MGTKPYDGNPILRPATYALREPPHFVVMDELRLPRSMAQKIPKETPSLESAMQRISEIVTSMEEGNLPLEKLIDSYEEGIGLVKECQEKLDAAEKRIQIITRNAQGAIALSEFEEQEN
jgi:exodeoxyribonuclease VII small subunit